MSSDLIQPERDDEGEPIWTVAGYTELDGTYHDLQDTDFMALDPGWYPGADTVTLQWSDADDGSTQYATLVGPWDDYDDLADVVDTYFEEGTP